jgi:hypothetical protein
MSKGGNMPEIGAFIKYFGTVKDLKKEADIVLESMYEFLSKEKEYILLSKFKEDSFEISLGNYKILFHIEVEIGKFTPGWVLVVSLLKNDLSGKVCKVRTLECIEIVPPSSVMAKDVGDIPAKSLKDNSKEGEAFIRKFLGKITRALQTEETRKLLDI